MWIAVDAMGGDHAPASPVEGAVQVAREDGTHVLLVGEEGVVERELERVGGGDLRATGLLDLVHAEEVVGMHEPAITPIRKKRRSSIRICAELVKEGRAQALVGAGNTGAAMISAKMVVGTINGVDRPALAAVLPTSRGRSVLLDVGANVGVKAEHLRQFAVMGHFFAQEILHTPSPRVGLLSIGEEEGKGTELTRTVFRVLETTGINFIGNVEGGHVFDGTVDVIVCDGFVGNVVLKSSESVAELIIGALREEIEKSLLARVGYLLARRAFRNLKHRTDYSEYGAAPLLGIEGGCFIGHGRSNAKAIANAIRRAAEFCEAELHVKMRTKLAEVRSSARRLDSAQEIQTS